ncbi:hypothetical protein RclHR1_24240006 [Rhizophagus clarus]|uniref:Uncharacterized protein n=1 Tax=Rhizophagus clarus TaxID=94130 RepID=A0A2Z6RD18_9GLOM|nr:hypothetical protein RclHR1_24240006 [Rhizophagus clarus]
MFDENIDAEKEEAFNEFIKEYGKRKEDWTIYDNDWHDWDDLFCEIKTHWNTKVVKYWKEKILKRFVYSLPSHVEVCGSSANFPAKILPVSASLKYVYVRSYVCMGASFSYYGFMNLGIKMSSGADNITLQCLIVPCGRLHSLPRDQVVQTVTVGRSQEVSVLEATIQSRLGHTSILFA